MKRNLSSATTELILHGNLFRAILAIAVPVVVTSFLQTLYNLTDTYWLGQIGTEPLAAINLVTPVQNIVLNFGSGLTVAGAVMISGSKHAPVVLTHTTCGRVVDLGITDANNMGAAMTPAAFDTLAAHFRDLGRGFADYDLVVTGDLGRLGRELLIELLREKKIDVDEGKLFDCGCEIFSERQDVHSGGSGCGCAASMLCAHLLPELAAGRLKRVLFMATGALLSPTSSMQGESVPGIAHAVAMEHRKEKGA